MKSTHFMIDNATGKYFRRNPEAQWVRPDAETKKEADLFSLEEIWRIGKIYYKTENRSFFRITEATASEFLSNIGRRGGKASSPAKTRAVKRNIKKRWDEYYHKKAKAA